MGSDADVGEQKYYSVREVAKELGVSSQKVRYYCNLGLIRGVRRGRGGYRELTSEQVGQIRGFCILSESGLSMKDLRHFSNLLMSGSAGQEEKKAFLATKKRQLWQKIEDLRAGIDFIERQEELIEKDKTL